MTDYPCLADTDTILQLVDAGGYEANLLVDPATDNALAIQADGLYAPVGPLDAARFYRNSSQAIASSTPVVFTSTRYDSTNGRMFSAGNLVTSRAGLWVFGACVSFDTGAVAGLVEAFLIASVLGTIAEDASGSPNVFGAGTAETIALNMNGACMLAAGSTVSLLIVHSFGGTIPTIASSTPPTAGAGCEFAGAELWAACVRPT